MMDSNLDCPEGESLTVMTTVMTDSHHHPEEESPMHKACADNQLPSSSRDRVTNEADD